MTGLRPARLLRGNARLLFMLAFLGLLFGSMVFALLRYVQVEETQLPDVSGMSISQATALLRERDLVPVTYPENVPGVAVDTVTSQTPPAGAVVRRGRRISLGVNKPPESARAPVLVGLSVDQALNTARATNIPLQSIEYSHGDQPAGRVVAQEPRPGEQVDAGSGLTIVVSRGPADPAVEMPDLTGMPLGAAVRRLEELGMTGIETVAVGVSFDAPGTVTTQTPVPGKAVPAGTPVLLSYNLSAGEVVPVPGVVGQPVELAERMLLAAGLLVGEVRYAESEDVPRGAVVEITPSGYTLRDTPVVLTVNAAAGSFDDLAAGDPLDGLVPEDERGGIRSLPRPGETGQDARGVTGEEDAPPVDGRRVTVTFDPRTLGVRALLERDYDLRLVVRDDAGERTVIDRRVRAGESVSAVVVVEGDAILQTYINGVFFQAWRP